MALNHGERKHLIEVSEPSLYLAKINNDLLSLYVNQRYPRYRLVHYLKQGRHTESRQSDAHRDTPEITSHLDCHTVRTANYS